MSSGSAKKLLYSRMILEVIQALEQSYEHLKARLIEDFEELVEPLLGA